MRRRRFPFDKPGRATLWGVIGCGACTAVATLGLGWALVITVATALAGCWDPA